MSKSLRRQDITFEHKDQALRKDVHMLGTLIGELLKEQGGDELFEFVETARLQSIRGYQLQVVATGSTEPTVLKQFHSPAGFGGVRIDDLSATLLATAVKWQIATIDGTVLLSSS